MNLRAPVLLLLLTACPERSAAPPAEPQSRAAATAAEARHTLLTLQVDPAGVRVLDVRAAPGPAPEPRAPQPAQPWRVELLDAQGQVVGATELAPPNLVRAPPVDGGPPAQVVTDSASFAVRLPLLSPAAARVRVLADPKTLTPAEAARLRPLREGRMELGEAALPR